MELFTLLIAVISIILVRKTIGSLTNTYHNEIDRNATLTRLECKRLYSIRNYLSLKYDHFIPPMMYAFQGSGNTWLRFLLEYATGLYTGSVYRNEALNRIQPGKCQRNVSIIKIHTNNYHFSHIQKGNFSELCVKGRIFTFYRALLLTRNPYDAIWSEYQRMTTSSKIQGVSKNDFNFHEWHQKTMLLADNYREMINVHYLLLRRKYAITRQSFPAVVDSHSSDDSKMNRFHYSHSHSTHQRRYIYVRYEDLTNKRRRLQELRRIISFLDLPAEYDLRRTSDYQQRLNCAFILAEKSNVSCCYC